MNYKLKPKTYLDISDWGYDKRQQFFPSTYNVTTYRVVFTEYGGFVNGYSSYRDFRDDWISWLINKGYKPLLKCNKLGEM